MTKFTTLIASAITAAAALGSLGFATAAQADVTADKGCPTWRCGYNGTALNGFTVNGWSLNGLTLNGLTLNGVTLNGPILQGIQFNGFTLNGPILQGIQFNGFTINGPSLQGKGTDVPQTGRVLAVTLANGVTVNLK